MEPRTSLVSDWIKRSDASWCVSLQICSPAEKKAIDKMIDSGPQLAGSMEYNVVLSEYLYHLLRQYEESNGGV